MIPPLRARLSGPAFRFAMLLRDFGHLDEQGLSQLLLAVPEEQALDEGAEPVLGVIEVRRAAAKLLFERSASEAEQGRTPLNEDWPLLFS